jgi:hypothetical protein
MQRCRDNAGNAHADRVRCTVKCPKCKSNGHRINRRATIGARLVELLRQINETEKQARKTPAKTLVAERRKVEDAKAILPYLLAERDAMNAELAGLTVLSPSNPEKP